MAVSIMIYLWKTIYLPLQSSFNRLLWEIRIRFFLHCFKNCVEYLKLQALLVLLVL